jgi:GNAT superfamily N-acetyltransferase
MQKVHQIDQKKIEHLLSKDIPSYSGILAGESKGEIWVDDPEKPALAMVYSEPVGGYHLFGEPTDPGVLDRFGSYINNDFTEVLRKRGSGAFEFSVESERTEAQVLRLFSDRMIDREEEYYFVHNGILLSKPPRDHDIHRVTPELLEEIKGGKVDNPAFLLNRLHDSWESEAQFFARSLAFVVIDGGTIAGVIIGTSRYKNRIPIDIEVKESHRRLGIAHAMTLHFLRACNDHGWVAHWNCVSSNPASKAAAEKTGFKCVRKRQVYWFSI